MLKEYDFFRGNIDKVKVAIARLQQFEPADGYYLAFSGGKDSITLKQLADLASVKYDAHYNNPTIDPPELVKFIRSQHSDVIFEQPPIPFLKRLETRGFPLRQRRWCCQEYKERGGSGKIVLTGMRYVNPIIDWSNEEVWQFIEENQLLYCSLYNLGWKRIGCLFCPMTYKKQRMLEVKRYPRYKRAFLRSFQKLYLHKLKVNPNSVRSWKDGIEMFNWWISGDQKKQQPDQLTIFE